MKKYPVGIALLLGTQAYAVELTSIQLGHLSDVMSGVVAVTPATIKTPNGASLNTTLETRGSLVLKTDVMRVEESFPSMSALEHHLRTQYCGKQKAFTGKFIAHDGIAVSGNFSLTEQVNRIYIQGTGPNGKALDRWFECSAM